MNRIKTFSIANPTGETPGMEPVRLDILKVAVNNAPTTELTQPEAAPAPHPTPVPLPAIPLINKNIRLPADLVEFVDFVYTKDNRLKKQDAYTQALEAYFRPLMTKNN